MNVNKLNRYFLFLLLVFISCKTELKQPIPKKHSELSHGKYEKYLNLLNEAYSTDNKFDAAIQLANLKAETAITYQTLNAAIKENQENCEQIYNWYWLYDRHNFGVNLVEHDTLFFKKSVTLCDNLYKTSSYEKYVLNKDQEEKDAIANRVKEDSTKFNMALVQRLVQIHLADQDIRNRMMEKSVTPESKEILSLEMNRIDSINLVKINKIFDEFGYPSRELVGKECNFTPALVIHHSNSLETRYKYLPFLEKAVQDGLLYEGTLDMIKRRIEDMELDVKYKRKTLKD